MSHLETRSVVVIRKGERLYLPPPCDECRATAGSGRITSRRRGGEEGSLVIDNTKVCHPYRQRILKGRDQ